MPEHRPRRVLVTGAGSGIGRAIAEALAGAGDAVVGTVRDPELVELTVNVVLEAGAHPD